MCLLLTVLELSLLVSLSTTADSHLVTTCTGRGETAWSRTEVRQSLEVWLRGTVSRQGHGQIQSRLRDLDDGSLTEHFSHFNDVHREPADELVQSEDEGERSLGSAVVIAQFEDGKPVGLAWQWRSKRFIDGFLYGEVDAQGKFTGENIIFIYPDLMTGLTGTFLDGSLIKGSAVKIVAERCSHGLKEILTKPLLAYEGHTWSSEDDISAHLHIVDPQEWRSVFVQKSQIAGSGEGLYARRNFEAGQLVSYYGGVLRDLKDLEQDNEDDNYTIEVGGALPGYNNDLVVDIPAGYRDVSQYRTTLAHKANHKFEGVNSEYDIVRHPYLGQIACIVAIKSIKKGAEILVNYNYDVKSAPKWYQKLYHQKVKRNRDYKQHSES